MSKIKIGGIIQNDHLSRISLNGVQGRVDTASELLKAFGDVGINVQFIVHSIDQHAHDHVIFCVDRDDTGRALDITLQVQESIYGQVVSHEMNVASVGIFGPDFRIRPGIAGTFFTALAQKGIKLHAISTSISTCTVIIPDNRLQDAILAIQETFELPAS